MVLAKMGHEVTHIDASRPAIGWAKENQKANSLPENSIRWILDDALKFVAREIKRGAQYDGIVMDPPAFGHAPTGKTWKFEKDFPPLLENCSQLLSGKKNFAIINSYGAGLPSVSLKNIVEEILQGGKLETGELCLEEQSGRLLSTGAFARWIK